MKLKSAIFKFDAGSVVWEAIGPGEINGRIYSVRYRVFVSPDGSSYITSMQANKTNSVRYMKKSGAGPKKA